jgi:NAD(P)-dependent dehydrogenase (short-subunit alcohol dehydrogenase family)
MDAQLRFDGKVAIVTGGGRGLGQAYARLLSSRGATVVVNDLGGELIGQGSSHGPADEVAEELRAAGGTAISDYGSVSDPAAMSALVSRTVTEFGRLDIVINNAGTRRIGTLMETSNEDFQSMLDVSLFGTINLVRAAWPSLVESRGSVVNTVSSSLFGLPEYSAYIVSKGAVFGLTRALAADACRVGIRVNAVAPAAVTRFMRSGGAATAILDWAEQALAPELVAPIVAYLAHADCPLNGVVLGGGGGQVGAWLLGETFGVLDRALTPERVRDNLEHILDPAGWQAYATSEDQGRRVHPYLKAALEAERPT